MDIDIVIQGDALEMLKTLPDESIDCCVTSPPYYGLRDYGTGIWVGGDPNCPHKRLSKYSPDTITGHAQEELRGNVGDGIYKTICPLCGAVRVDKQIGLEETPEEYVKKLTDIFHEVKRVLKDDGTLWLNMGDTYNGNKIGNTEYIKNPALFESQGEFRKKTWNGAKQKDLIGIPWMLAFSLRSDGWYLRQDIIWHKPNPMPESVKDRCTKSHEYVFLLSKSPHYYFDNEAIQERSISTDARESALVRAREKGYNTKDRLYPENYLKNIKADGSNYGDNNDKHYATYSGNTWEPNGYRNKRDVWTVPTKPCTEAHFATFPEDLVKPCILAGSRQGGIVLDPFFGAGTTGRVAEALNRHYIGIELNPEYIEISHRRLNNVQMELQV